MPEYDINLIWNKFSENISAYIQQKVKDKELANDLSQEVFLKLHQSLPSLREHEKVSAWLYKIAHNQIMDHYRTQKKLTGKMDSWEYMDTEDSFFKNKELASCIIPMIEKLPPKYREAMYISEVEGLSQKDLAQRLGISYSGAKSRVQRGKKMLKDLFLKCCIIEHDAYGNIIDFRKRCSCA